MTSIADHKAPSVFSNKLLHFEFRQKKVMQSQVLLKMGLLKDIEWRTIFPEHKVAIHFVITDKNVDALYGKKLLVGLSQAGFSVQKFVINPGERAKSFKVYGELSQKILRSGITKDSFVLGFGGGVVNNIAGFLSSTLYRGIGLVQIPTTLMAQADAAVDFKQAINSRVGKNHIGSYYPAATILIDPSLLQTLSIRHIRNGLGEVIKHAITQDKKLFTYLLGHTQDVTDEDFLQVVVFRTIELKVRLLNRPHGSEYAEMIPQYGHAVGHALEQLSSYALLHGEALAIGMCVMSEVAMELGLCDNDTVKAHYRVLKDFNLPTGIPQKVFPDALLRMLRHDKHHIGMIQSAIVSRIGRVCKHGINCTFSIPAPVLRRAFTRNQKRGVSEV